MDATRVGEDPVSMRRTLAWACIALATFAGVPGTSHSTCSQVFLGRPNDVGFGVTVTTPGDLNADGHADIAIGATTFDANGDAVPGRVDVFFGGPGSDAVADRVLQGESVGDRFGYVLAGAGDLNADTYPDLVVGAYQNDVGGSNIGRAYVYFGGPGFDAVADVVLTGAFAGEQFGIAVDGAGDLNGDGRDDLVVGARFSPDGGFQSGRAYVYFGDPGFHGSVGIVLPGHGGSERFGFSVAGGGDLNDDGFDDVVVGAYTSSPPSAFEAGRAYVYFGGPALDAVADRVLDGSGSGAHFSDGLGIGDVDGDSRADLLVGASQYAGHGRAYVFRGGPGFDATADLVLDPTGGATWFGRSVSGGADLNGDARPDLVVGAPELAGGPGRMFVYHGGPGLDAIPEVVLLGNHAEDAFGWSCAAESGRSDLLVGAFRHDATGFDAGRADLFRDVPCIRVTCPMDTTVYSGQPAPRRICIENCAPAAVDLEVQVSDTAGWCPATTQPVTVPGGGTACMTVACAAPADAGCVSSTTLNILVEVAGCEILASACSARILAVPPPVCVQLACPPDTLVAAGDTLKAAFCITNCATTPTTWNYGINDDLDWCPPRYGQVHVDPGDSVCVRTTCIAPLDAPCGVPNALRLAVYPPCGGPVQGCSTTIGITSLPCLTSTCPPETTVTAGTTFQRSFCAANCGGDSLELDYTLQDTAGWCAPDLGKLVLAPGESQCVIAACTAATAACTAVDTLRLDLASQACPALDRTCRAVVLTRPPAQLDPKMQFSAAAGDVEFGIRAALPGDLNGDGHGDVVIGAAGETTPGRVHAYFGGPGLDAVPDLVLSGEADGDRFGYVSGAGDANGDGFVDLVVGAFRNDTPGDDAGRAYVYFGGPALDATPDRVLNGEEGEQFGIAVDGIGDVNADGWDDILVGARFNAAGGYEAGRAYVYFGGPAADADPDLVVPAQSGGERMGFTVARAGDVNADGHADFLVGAYHNSDFEYEAGRAYVYFGGPGLDAVPDVVLAGSGFRAHFSDGLAAADVNDDGVMDVLVGASQYDIARGRAYAYFGGAGMDAVADLVFDPGLQGDWFGRFVSGGADLNGDAHPDLVIGAPSATRGGPGRAYVYHGGPGIDAECDAILEGESPGDHFGWNGCAEGNDVNDDGLPEILVGAYEHRDVPTSTGGRAYLYRPFDTVPIAVLDFEARASDAGVHLRWRLAGPSRVEGVRIQRAATAAGPYADLVSEPLRPAAEMSYVDATLARSATAWYRLVVLHVGGGPTVVGPIPASATGRVIRTALHGLREAHGGVEIRFALGARSAPRLDIFDVAGRRVRTIEPGPTEPGEHLLAWDRTDAAGRRAARGLYAVRLVAGGERFARKLVLLRP